MALLHRAARNTFFTQRLRSLSRPSHFSTSSSDKNPNASERDDSASDFPIPVVSYSPLPEDSLPPPPRRRDRKDDVVIPIDAVAADAEYSLGFSSSSVIPAAYEVKPKVAPLPEYRPREEDTPLAPKPVSQPRFRPRIHTFVAEDELDIPLPTKVKVETRRRPDPVTLVEAIRQVKEKAKARFDESVEAAIRLGIDPKRSDQLVRGAATLPRGRGKTVRVAVFAEDDEAEEARSVGADVVGAEDLIDQILQSGGKLDFDKCLATPSMMPRLSKVARILGPRGLMPNPKVGTVTKDVGKAVKSLKEGRVDFRADKTGIVHAGVGKVSFSEEALQDNIAAFANAVLAAKPTGLKKTSKYAGYMITFTISSTMGPGIRVAIPSISQAVDNFTRMMGVPQ